jgi:hypothetical protein
LENRLLRRLLFLPRCRPQGPVSAPGPACGPARSSFLLGRYAAGLGKEFPARERSCEGPGRL